MKNNDVLVGTPEVFRRAMKDKAHIHPAQFSLIVFDECHNAAGNSSMARIMRDSVLIIPDSSRPRILGLTASFVSGSTANVPAIMKKRDALVTLFQATLYSPIMPINPNEQKQENKFNYVNYPDMDLMQYEIVVKSFIKEVLSSIPTSLFDEMDNWVNKGWNLFVSVGSEGLRYVRVWYLHVYLHDVYVHLLCLICLL